MGNKTDIKYLSPVDIELRQQNKYCRFKKMGIDYIDYKDPEFLMRFLNEQGKILPRRITGNSLKFQRRLAVSVKRARQIYEKLLTQRNEKIWWKHVKGHSDHLINDGADRLADEGAKMSPWEATVDREIWWKVRGDGGLKHNHHKGRNARLRTTIKWIEGNAHVTQKLYAQEDCKGWNIGPNNQPWDTHYQIFRLETKKNGPNMWKTDADSKATGYRVRLNQSKIPMRYNITPRPLKRRV
jgi:small subunit ribosomal protein S18